MGYAESVWGRAIQVQEVLFRAIAGEIHWFRGAGLSGVSARTMHRWRVALIPSRGHFPKGGYDVHDGHRHQGPARAPDIHG